MPAHEGCTRESGTCHTCRSGCTRKPGWFLPGEAEKAAEYLGLSLEEFFQRYLAVDWWQGEPNLFVLSPSVVGGEPGTEFPFDPRGTCVFYNDGRCDIHAVKPHECRDHWCGAPGDKATHRETADAWTGHEDQIRALLGRDPELPEPTLGDLLSLLFSVADS